MFQDKKGIRLQMKNIQLATLVRKDWKPLTKRILEQSVIEFSMNLGLVLG